MTENKKVISSLLFVTQSRTSMQQKNKTQLIPFVSTYLAPSWQGSATHRITSTAQTSSVGVQLAYACFCNCSVRCRPTTIVGWSSRSVLSIAHTQTDKWRPELLVLSTQTPGTGSRNPHHWCSLTSQAAYAAVAVCRPFRPVSGCRCWSRCRSVRGRELVPVPVHGVRALIVNAAAAHVAGSNVAHRLAIKCVCSVTVAVLMWACVCVSICVRVVEDWSLHVHDWRPRQCACGARTPPERVVACIDDISHECSTRMGCVVNTLHAHRWMHTREYYTHVDDCRKAESTNAHTNIVICESTYDDYWTDRFTSIISFFMFVMIDVVVVVVAVVVDVNRKHVLIMLVVAWMLSTTGWIRTECFLQR